MSKPKTIHKVIIDGDIIAYRAAAGTEGMKEKDAKDKVDTLVNYIVSQTVVFPTKDNLKCYLTGKENFRFDVAKTAPYKGNRTGVTKPTHLLVTRAWLERKWGAEVSVGEEADDLVGIASAKSNPETTVVCTIDKDMMQLPGWNYNFAKDTWTYITVDTGNKFFYTQILTGDAADNIKGIYRVGPVKAAKILEGLASEQELYEACVKAYNGDTDRVLENARLLWLRRYEGQMWEPPEVTREPPYETR
jgi:DNA polymerase-1